MCYYNVCRYVSNINILMFSIEFYNIKIQYWNISTESFHLQKNYDTWKRLINWMRSQLTPSLDGFPLSGHSYRSQPSQFLQLQWLPLVTRWHTPVRAVILTSRAYALMTTAINSETCVSLGPCSGQTCKPRWCIGLRLLPLDCLATASRWLGYPIATGLVEKMFDTYQIKTYQITGDV